METTPITRLTSYYNIRHYFLPRLRNFLGLSGTRESGTDSSQYGEKNEMINIKNITLVKKTANFNVLDAKNHSPNAMMSSLVIVATIKNWTDWLQPLYLIFLHA